MIFEIFELVTLVLAFVAFILLLFNFIKMKKKSKIIFSFFLIGTFLLLNRLFTNLEFIFCSDFLNLLEHLSIASSGIVHVYATWLKSKELRNERV